MTCFSRTIACLLAMTTLCTTGVAQQHPVKITFKTPEGWRGETITLPPGFARDMSLKGVEEIRFAPGMFKADKEDFFSYALVFWLPENKPLDQKTMHAELLKYYKGLAAAVGKGKQLNIDTSKFTLKIQPVEKKKGQYTATLNWVEPFVTGKAQTLQFELATGNAKGTKASFLSMAVSPQGHDHAIWKSLRKVIASVKYHPVPSPKATDEK